MIFIFFFLNYLKRQLLNQIKLNLFCLKLDTLRYRINQIISSRDERKKRIKTQFLHNNSYV